MQRATRLFAKMWPAGFTQRHAAGCALEAYISERTYKMRGLVVQPTTRALNFEPLRGTAWFPGSSLSWLRSPLLPEHCPGRTLSLTLLLARPFWMVLATRLSRTLLTAECKSIRHHGWLVDGDSPTSREQALCRSRYRSLLQPHLCIWRHPDLAL